MQWTQDAFDDIVDQGICSDEPGGTYTYGTAAFSLQPVEALK